MRSAKLADTANDVTVDAMVGGRSTAGWQNNVLCHSQRGAAARFAERDRIVSPA
jgi:hypothetical protein